MEKQLCPKLVAKIHRFCKKHGVNNYSINPDGSIDIDGGVCFMNFKEEFFPIPFNKVSGFFECVNCNLTTFKNMPREIGRWLLCSNTPFRTFEHFPLVIKEGLHIDNLTTPIPIKEYNALFQMGYTPDQIHNRLDLSYLYRIFTIQNIISDDH